MRLDSVNRRGHVFLGVATRQAALGSYLGADRHGWGYLVSQDLYHGGSRLRSGYGSRMSAGMTVELTLNTDIGLFSVGNADTGEDFGPAMNNLYEDMGGSSAAGGGGVSLGIGGGVVGRDAGRGGGTGAAPRSAVAAAATLAAAAAATGGGGRGGGGGDLPGTLWPAFAMHQPGDSVTFLRRRAEDGYSMPRTLSGAAVAAAAAAATATGGCYRSLQALMSSGSGSSGVGGMMGGVGTGAAGKLVFAAQALPLGYPDPILLGHACSALEMAAGVLRDAGQSGVHSEDEADGAAVAAR